MLEKNIRFLKGVGPTRAGQLCRLGIRTIGDLLLHIPRIWFDRRSTTSIASVDPGTEVTVTGEIVHVGERTIRGGRRLLQAVLSDGTGRITLTFFRPQYIRSRLSVGTRLSASGRVELYGGLSIAHPELIFHAADAEDASAGGGVIPVYPLSAGISQGVMRKLVRHALSEVSGSLPDVLPADELKRYGWDDRHTLFQDVHMPSSPEAGQRARRILALEELYLYQLVLRMVRETAASHPATAYDFNPARICESFSRTLPYCLTGAQQRVSLELLEGMTRSVPMRRLLQGDVGSGKTVVAALACHACCLSGGQAVVLAPTEVLAAQHMQTFSSLLAPFGHRCRLLTGGTPRSERRELLDLLYDGDPGILIGTHAVLEEDVVLPGLGLLVVDEQHKFGVTQREALLAGRDPRPHMVIMSATPIPRTLAMTFYGDLDLSVIDEMPPGRGSIRTEIVTSAGRMRVYDFLRKRLEAGERAYIVYPLREATDSADLHDARSAWETITAGLWASMVPACSTAR